MRKSEVCDALPAFGVIRIDNHDEVAGGADGEMVAMAAVKIRDYIRGKEGVLYPLQAGKYAFVAEESAVGEMREEKYLLLDQVRDITTVSGMPVTLSIGLGVGESVEESAAFADQALMLAQGRGGDQAVEKIGEDYNFYGGRQQPGERYSRVKIRVFAQTLKQLISQYERVYVMGHKMPDYDAIGAALGVVYCAQLAKRQAFLVLDEATAMVENVLGMALLEERFSNVIISPQEAMLTCDSRGMVVVVDTQRSHSIPAPELLDRAGAVAVIDHHRRGASAIKSTLQHVQVSSSSCSELVCEIVEYFGGADEPPPILSSALLAGITMDTKHFAINTGARTLEAAAYLYRHGANSKMVMGFFQDDIQTYLERAEIVRSAHRLPKNILLGSYNVDKPDANRVAAQAADTMATMKGVEGAFVLYTQGGTVNVSARSTGDMNVQVVLEALGGGGHLNAAGARLHSPDISTAEQELTAALKEYWREEEEDKTENVV